jgi:hypothetical protein
MNRSPARTTTASLLLGAITIVATLGLTSSAVHAVETDDDGIGITVTVTPGSQAPADVAAPGSPAATSPYRPTTPVADVVAPAIDTPVLADDEVDLGGVLFVSGLSSAYDWSINPLGGAAETSITVRNVSKSTFDSTVRFWADGPIGNRLSEVAGVKVTDLKPGESRTIDASLGGIGQSTFVQLHATLKPPAVIDGVQLDSITRDQFIVVPPWGLLALIGLGALALAVLSILQWARRPLYPSGLPAGAAA